MITHHSSYARIYKTQWITVMIVFCWVCAYGMQLPTLFGIWGEFPFFKNDLNAIFHEWNFNVNFFHKKLQVNLDLTRILAHVQFYLIQMGAAVRQHCL